MRTVQISLCTLTFWYCIFNERRDPYLFQLYDTVFLMPCSFKMIMALHGFLFFCICGFYSLEWLWSGFLLLSALFWIEIFSSLRGVGIRGQGIQTNLLEGRRKGSTPFLTAFMQKWTQQTSPEFELCLPIPHYTVRWSFIFLLFLNHNLSHEQQLRLIQ